MISKLKKYTYIISYDQFKTFDSYKLDKTTGTYSAVSGAYDVTTSIPQ